MAHDLLIRNVRPMGGPLTDLFIRAGRFAEAAGMSGTEEIDAEGHVALPGLVEAHTHLDKTLIGMPWYQNTTGPTRGERILADRKAKRELAIDAGRQAARQIRQTLAFGVTHIRSHVDVDTEIGIANVEGVAAIRDRFKGIVDVQIVAFPQSGMLVRDGTLALMDEAMKAGADLVGGIDPATIERNPVEHLDAIFELADRHAKPIDIHLHEPGALGAFCLELITERTRALGMQGRVMVSHAYCLGMLDPAVQGALIEAMAAEKIAVMSAGSPAAPALPLQRLRRAGVVVASGSDGIQGIWEPWGRGDMLERAKILAQRNGLTRDVDLAEMADICTFGGAAALGLGDYGFAPGCKGDLVLVAAGGLAEAVALTPLNRTVIRGGRILVRDGIVREDFAPIE
ncbi:amidohydrolase [Labrys neptuniae]